MTKEKKEKIQYEKPSLTNLDEVAHGAITCGVGDSATTTCTDGGAATVTCGTGGGD